MLQLWLCPEVGMLVSSIEGLQVNKVLFHLGGDASFLLPFLDGRTYQCKGSRLKANPQQETDNATRHSYL